MATNLCVQVQQILALKPALRPASDELGKRVQFIRVRSLHESNSRNETTGWRRHQSHQDSSTSRWRQPSTVNNYQHPSTTQNTVRFTSSSASLNSLASNGSVSPVVSPTPTGPPMRYVSRFHNGSKVGDDQILNTVILNKLNVFSVKTYDDVKNFLFQILGSDQREFVREFTWLVFRKAAAEDKYCALFAQLLADIRKEYPVILEEIQQLHTTYLDIWDVTGSNCKVDRSCRLGYSQFLAELTVLHVLDAETISKTLETLKRSIHYCLPEEKFKETVEEYFDCLRRLCSAKISKEIQQVICSILLKDFETWITEDRQKNPGLSNKSRFACMDLKDLLSK